MYFGSYNFSGMVLHVGAGDPPDPPSGGTIYKLKGGGTGSMSGGGPGSLESQFYMQEP